MIGIDAALNEVEYDENLQALQVPVTTVDMRKLKNDLETIVIVLRGIPAAGILADDVETEVDVLKIIIDNELPPVELTRGSIGVRTMEAQTISSSMTIPEIINDMNEAQHTFNNDISDHISNALIASLDELLTYIENLLSAVEDRVMNDLAPCRPVYDAYQTFISATCIYFLSPFNALML